MSTWETILLADVNPNQEPVPEGDYAFTLRGASPNNFNPAKLDVSAVISSEGDFMGRLIRFSYPDPNEFDWSARTVKRLEIALGIDSLPGESTLEFLNRAGQEGARFSAPIKTVTYKHRETGEDITKNDVDIFKVTAAI